MLCQFCGKNEATNKFYVSLMGLGKEVFLCDDCLTNFKKHALMPGGHSEESEPEKKDGEQAVWMISNSQPKYRKLDKENIEDAGKEIKVKRKLNQLHKKLSDAVKAEKYEDAAAIRDEINQIKKEVYINGK